MLKDHRYFHFRPFSDKSNDLIFFQSPKTLFYIFFDLFGGPFPNNQPLSILNPHGPSGITFKNTNVQILRKVC